MKTLWLKKGEDRRIRAGHLWIFSNEIDSAKSPLPDFEPGENATLRDARGAVLGSVFVNPHSLICARLYSRKADLPLDADLLRQRLQSALGLRQRLYNQPWYRLCHGEGDLLPGLVMDRFGDHLTVQVGTWGMEARKEELREVLGELLQPRSILWDNDIAARSLEGLPRENESEGRKTAASSGPPCRAARRPAGSMTSAATAARPPATPQAPTCWTSSATPAASAGRPPLPVPVP